MMPAVLAFKFNDKSKAEKIYKILCTINNIVPYGANDIDVYNAFDTDIFILWSDDDLCSGVFSWAQKELDLISDEDIIDVTWMENYEPN